MSRFLYDESSSDEEFEEQLEYLHGKFNMNPGRSFDLPANYDTFWKKQDSGFKNFDAPRKYNSSYSDYDSSEERDYDVLNCSLSEMMLREDEEEIHHGRSQSMEPKEQKTTTAVVLNTNDLVPNYIKEEQLAKEKEFFEFVWPSGDDDEAYSLIQYENTAKPVVSKSYTEGRDKDGVQKSKGFKVSNEPLDYLWNMDKYIEKREAVDGIEKTMAIGKARVFLSLREISVIKAKEEGATSPLAVEREALQIRTKMNIYNVLVKDETLRNNLSVILDVERLNNVMGNHAARYLYSLRLHEILEKLNIDKSTWVQDRKKVSRNARRKLAAEAKRDRLRRIQYDVP